MSNVLVLEDLDDSFFLIKNAVGDQHRLTWAKTVAEAMSAYNENVDIILADIGLPDGDGYQFCDWVRSKMKDTKTPIMFISSKCTTESRITGFSLGGDDFIGKPFNVVELKTRIDAKLKRAGTQVNFVQEVNGIGIDLRSQSASIRENGKQVDLDLTPIEFKILCLFISEPDRVLSRDEILNRVWGAEIFVYPRSVDTHVSKLRSKLRGRGDLIRSVHGVGYKFQSQPEARTITPLAAAAEMSV
jgi:two-component system response regulator ResD